MKFVAILVLSVSTICIVADVDVKRHGGGGGGGGWFRRCRVVANGTTDCAGVTGSDCRDSTALAGLLTSNKTQAPVCQGYSAAPVLTDIQVAYRLPGVECRTYLGVTSICFIPDESVANQTCAILAAANSTKASCTDQTVLRTRIATPTMRICLLNASATPPVFTETNVTLFAQLAGRVGAFGGSHSREIL